MKARLSVLVLFGPTAVGKTAVLDRLFGGRDAPFKAEVVSADSMQVYRGMDIGTAKPDSALRDRLPHHLIDIRDPDETFNLGDFVRLADAACLEIAARGALPVVCGGTGFYLKHFVLGLPEAPPADLRIRDELKAELETRGAEALMLELSAVDPEAAARIHLNDHYRLTRALEVHRSSGRPLSSFKMAGGGSSPESGRPAYRFLSLSLERDRDDLYRRIGGRCRQMFESGLPEEVARLRSEGYGPDAPGMRAIGYREFFAAESATLGDIEEETARNSRRYAKRQSVFAYSIPDLAAVRADIPPEDLAAGIESRLRTFLGEWA